MNQVSEYCSVNNLTMSRISLKSVHFVLGYVAQNRNWQFTLETVGNTKQIR